MPNDSPQKNVLGTALDVCSLRPKTGWRRNGCCETDDHDRGSHVVCAQVTAEFLAHQRSQGNDLSTPRPEYDFPGLKPGDRWCLCVARWKQALEAGCAPRVFLQATHANALQLVTLEQLTDYAADSN
jgi:uncharacterized protein